MRRLLALAALASGLIFGLATPGAGAVPGPPVVSGPRDTTLEWPVYALRAPGASGFRCAFDSSVLVRCPRSYSTALLPGTHTLRVRSVGRHGELSRVVVVRVAVHLPVPELTVDWTTFVGPGAGVPAPDGASVWVPVTSSGTLVRLSQPDGTLLSSAAVGVPTNSTSALDSAYADIRSSVQRDIWYASDDGAKIVRLDHGTSAVTGAVDVVARPAGMTSQPPPSAAVWSFHLLQDPVTRIDPTNGTATTFQVPGAPQATGIAWGEGSLWLLTTQPARVLELDDATLSVKRTIDLHPLFARGRSSADTRWLTLADGALWATLPSYGAVARVDTSSGDVRYFRVPYGTPSGIAVGAGFAWVATDHTVLQLDEKTGALRAAAIIPSASRTGVMPIAFGYAAAWVTNYDRGTISRLPLPPT
jgi:hypothetical protein